MNGEFKELYSNIQEDFRNLDKQLTRVQTLMEEKWTSHDKRADERRERINYKVDNLDKKLNQLPCDSSQVKIDNIGNQIKLLWTGFFFVIITGIVLGVWIN